MANSCTPGLLNGSADNPSPRTPGPLGVCDAADPSWNLVWRGERLADPEKMLDHDVAFAASVYGMVNGSFRGDKGAHARKHEPGRGMVGGYKLQDYGSDYVGARAIINGDPPNARVVAGYARHFERLIQTSRIS